MSYLEQSHRQRQSRYDEDGSSGYRRSRHRYNDDAARRELQRREERIESQSISKCPRGSHGAFCPGYGVRVSREVEPLPPLRDRVGPDGARHRVYPAATEISPPSNLDEGWTSEVTLHNDLQKLQISPRPRSLAGRNDTSPVVEASCPVASVALQAASTEQKKSKGAYIPWVGVEYSDPSLVQDEPPTREEILEVLAGMRRNKCPRSAPEGGRDKNDGGRGDNGWGTPASQSGGNDNGWSSQPGHVDSTAGQAQINGTGDAQQSPRSWTGGRNEPAHPTRSHPDPQQPSMTPPRSVSGIHPDRLRLMGLAPSSEQSTPVVSASLDEPQHPPAVNSGWVLRNQRGSPRGDFHASTSPPARNGDAHGKDGNDYGYRSSYRSRNDQLAGDNWASSSNAPQRSYETDDAPRVSQGNIWNQGERFEEAPLGATADDDRYGGW